MRWNINTEWNTKVFKKSDQLNITEKADYVYVMKIKSDLKDKFGIMNKDQFTKDYHLMLD